MLTSVDHEGTRDGFDLALIKAVATAVRVPVIASGGMGNPDDAVKAVREGMADAVAMADILHYNRATMGDIRATALAAGVDVRVV